MKVLIVVFFEPIPALDGGTRKLRFGQLADALKENGHIVDVITSDFDHYKKIKRSGPKYLKDDTNGLVTYHLVESLSYKKNISIRRFFHIKLLARSVASFLKAKDFKPDVIVCSLPTVELCNVVSEFYTDTPVIIDVVDKWPDIYLNAVPNFARHFVKYLLSKEYSSLRKALSKASAITGVSKSYVHWANDHLGIKSPNENVYFPLGYNYTEVSESYKCEFFRSLKYNHKIAYDKFTIVFIGQFGSSYDLDTIVNVAKILEFDSRFQFILVGDGDQRKSIEKQSASLSNFHLLGWLNAKQISAILSISTLGLCSYKKSALQSLPYKPFEYLSSGLPLLSSLEGDLADLIALYEIGFYYNAEDSDALANILLMLVDDLGLISKMKENCRKIFSAHFESKVVYNNYTKWLETKVKC